MNKRVRNFKALDHPIHHTFLNYFHLIFLVAILLFSFSLWKARTDLKRIADSMRIVTNLPAPREAVAFYRVQPDDTLEDIADEFDISTQTIIWANDDIVDNELIPDMIIRIPPVNGVIHEVQIGETTTSLAQMYSVSEDKIKNFPFNTFTDSEKDLPTIGQILIIPDGKRDSENVLGEFIRRILNTR